MPRLLFVALLLIITVLALAPMPDDLDGFGRDISSGSDKSDHLAAFAALALSGTRAWARVRRVALAAGLISYGAVIELLQTQMPGRQGDPQDLAVDALGIGLGLVLAALLARLRVERSKN